MKKDYEQISLGDEKILLLGGAGFIGHHLALELKNKNAKVMVLDNLQVNNIVNVLINSEFSEIQRKLYIGFILDRFSLMRKAGIEFSNLDARDLNSLTDIYNKFKPTKIVHLSAIASAVNANLLPSLAYDVQINTLRNILDLCKNYYGITNQIIFMSSSTVYGDFKTESVNEEMRPMPRGVYANGKYMGERMVREAGSLHNLDYTIIRPSALYGIRCISGRVSQKFVENALFKKPLILEGGGNGLLDFTHVDDLVEGIVRALFFKSARSQTFNITFGKARKIKDLVRILEDKLPSVKIKNAPLAKDKPIRGTLEIERAKKLLNFFPSRSLEIGYAEYCEWYLKKFSEVSKN